MFVNLRRFPKSVDAVREVVDAIRNHRIDEVGSVCEWPEDRVRAGDWSPVQEEVMPDTEDLYKAIEADDVDRIEQLLTERPGLVNSTEQAPPPIHWAIYRDKRGAVEALLNHGADLTLRDRDRDATPLD